MSYAVSILRRAQKELAGLNATDYEHVRDSVARLANDPRPHGCKKRQGATGGVIRTGTFRVICEVDDVLQTSTVLHIGHRRDVYE